MSTRVGDPNGLTRRELLKGMGAAGASLSLGWGLGCGGDGGPDDGLPVYQYDGPRGPEDLFQHAVASGDPLPDGILLWTRVTPGTADAVDVWWEIAVDPRFRTRVQVGTVSTGPERDHTVKVDVRELTAGTTYYYRFMALGRTSPVGRTRTAPSGSVERLRFAVASCASLAHGHFHAYDSIAARLDLDAVIHLGDYIYEYAAGAFGNIRQYEPEHEIVSLADYRQRHSQYKREAPLQGLHRQHPIIAIWDDHEFANNAWSEGAGNHDPAAEGDWAARKAAAMQAYFEWMPVREGEGGRIFRNLVFGDLAELVLLDTRIWHRDATTEEFLAPMVDTDPARTILGDDQAMWLEERLASATAQWKLVGQQVMMANLNTDMMGGVVNPDQWHGYPASRARFLDAVERMGTENVVVLTGDLHTSIASELVVNSLDPAMYDPATGEGAVAVEFLCPGVTSPGLPATFRGAIEGIRPFNPHVRWFEITQRGYVVLDVDRQRTQAAWFLFEDADIVSPTATMGEALGAVWSVQTGTTRLVEETEPAAPRPDPPLPAPEA